MSDKNDKEARGAILRSFYEAYMQHGLHVIVMMPEVAGELKLDEPQARRCFDYLRAKGFIKLMTRGGGYCPTVALVDEMEEEGAP